MGRIVFTGIGVVSPIGTGKEQFCRAVINNYSGIRRIRKIPSQVDSVGGEIEDFDCDQYINDRRFRRAAEISKYALVAAKLAIEDTGNTVNGEKAAMVMGITHGALNYTQEFHRAIIKNDIDAISPILFSDSVFNAPAGNASICFGIKGPVHTIVGGSDVTIKAIMLGSRMLANGSADKVIIVSAEELNELSFFCYSRKGIGALSEGAGAIVMEKEDSVKELPYCYISGMASCCNPSTPRVLMDVVKECLTRAGLRSADIGLILTDSTVDFEYMPDVPVGSINSLAGNAFSATTMWHAILSCFVLKNSELPTSIIRNKVSAPNSAGNVLVCSLDKHGVASAIILSKL
ncbi:MAG: beta-ketoacyl synthase chain length factor [Nitrospirae bacterium]|nr:beta-ketoacyl synthase chain length factor [Nitrospirota bacterium]